MTERERSLVEIVRDRTALLCEASELTREGHFYLFRYDGMEGRFYRATVPSGAADLHFRALEATDKIPLGGWLVIEKSESSRRHLQLVSGEKERPRHCDDKQRRGRTSNDGRG